MAEKNRIDVAYCGKTLKLAGEESEAYMHSVADFVDKKIKELSKHGTLQKLGQELVNVLAAIHITDMLYKEREKSEQFEDELNKKNIELQEKDETYEKCLYEFGKTQSEAIALKEKLLETQLEIDYYKQKLYDTTQELSTLRKKFDSSIETVEAKGKKDLRNTKEDKNAAIEYRHERKRPR